MIKKMWSILRVVRTREAVLALVLTCVMWVVLTMLWPNARPDADETFALFVVFMIICYAISGLGKWLQKLSRRKRKQ